jgi:hypothetical protein
VTIHNDATNAEIHLTADESGYFKAPLPGAGHLHGDGAAGFSEYPRRRQVIVQVGQLTTLSRSCDWDSATQVVEVTARRRY